MNDLTLIMADVTRSKRSETPIHDGTARTIANSWHGGMWTDLYAFASSGHIGESLALEIESAIENVKANPQNFDAHNRVQDLGTPRYNVAMLTALLDYVNKAGLRGPVNGWHHRWVDFLSPEDEYNSDDE